MIKWNPYKIKTKKIIHFPITSTLLQLFLKQYNWILLIDIPLNNLFLFIQTLGNLLFEIVSFIVFYYIKNVLYFSFSFRDYTKKFVVNVPCKYIINLIHKNKWHFFYKTFRKYHRNNRRSWYNIILSYKHGSYLEIHFHNRSKESVRWISYTFPNNNNLYVLLIFFWGIRAIVSSFNHIEFISTSLLHRIFLYFSFIASFFEINYSRYITVSIFSFLAPSITLYLSVLFAKRKRTSFGPALFCPFEYILYCYLFFFVSVMIVFFQIGMKSNNSVDWYHFFHMW